MAYGVSRGTPQQLRDAVERQIQMLGGGDDIVEESTDIRGGSQYTRFTHPEARKFPVEDVVDFLGNKGYDTSDWRVKNYADATADYMDMSRQAYENADMDWPYTLDQWYDDTRMNYPENLEELPRIDSAEEFEDAEYSYDIVEASDEDLDEVVDIDDDADPIEAEDIENIDIDEEPVEAAEETEDAVDDEVDLYDDGPDFEIYITDVSEEVSNAIEQDLDADYIDWTNDDENMYITVTIGDKVHEFTVPYSDLKQDKDEDVEYIVKNIKEQM